MYKERKSSAPWAWLVITALLSSVGCAGCAHGQRKHHNELVREFHRAAPQRNQIREADAEFGREDVPLKKKALLSAVLARNPDLESARMAWRVAIAKQPQATAIRDLRIDYSFAPLSIGSDKVDFGQMIRLHQRFSWPGQLLHAGNASLAEASAVKHDYEAIRLDLVLMTSMLFDEYAKFVRLLELNEQHRALTEDIKTAAVAQYSAGRAPQQEPLQAEVELSHVVHQRVLLKSDRDVVVSRINQLLHRRPQATLGPPLRDAFVERKIAESESLQQEAIEARPEIAAHSSRIDGRESALKSVRQGYFPGFGVMGEYNSMWRSKEHQWMLGFSLDVPVQFKARRGAIDQADAELRMANALRESAVDAVRSEVDQSRHRVVESEHVIGLYRSRLLPTVRAQIEAATIGYQTGQNSFQALIDAERSLRTLEVHYEEALTVFEQNRARLDRAMGHVSGVENEGGTR